MKQSFDKLIDLVKILQQQQQQQPQQSPWMMEAGPPPPPPVSSGGPVTPGPPPSRSEMWHHPGPHPGEPQMGMGPGPPIYSSRMALNGSQPCLMIPESSAHGHGPDSHVLFDDYYSAGQLLFDAQCGNGKNFLTFNFVYVMNFLG